MTTNQSLIRQPNPTIGQYTTHPHRRTFLGGALGALLASQGRVLAEDTDAPNNPFILLLHGVYQPVAHGPNLGLKSVNLSDGTYSKTEIYPIFGINGSKDQDRTIGDFF